MTEKIKILALALLLAAGLMLVSFFAGWKIQPPVTDTVVIHTVDTLTVTERIRDTVTKTYYKTIQVPFYVVEVDTDVDSARVTLPFEQHHAQLEDVADVWVSGYMVNIDSARVYKTTITEIIRQPYEVTVPKNPLLTLDVGIGNHEWKSLDPYVFARATINADKWKIEPYVGYTYSKQPMFGVSVSRSFTLIK